MDDYSVVPGPVIDCVFPTEPNSDVYLQYFIALVDIAETLDDLTELQFDALTEEQFDALT